MLPTILFQNLYFFLHPEYLMDWEGYSPEQHTCESAHHVLSRRLFSPTHSGRSPRSARRQVARPHQHGAPSPYQEPALMGDCNIFNICNNQVFWLTGVLIRRFTFTLPSSCVCAFIYSFTSFISSFVPHVSSLFQPACKKPTYIYTVKNYYKNLTFTQKGMFQIYKIATKV